MHDAPSAPHLPAPGDIVAQKYRIDRVIGRGGMGVVYAATHLLLQQTVALKLLASEIAAHPDAVTRFLNEARAAARIRNEHVAAVMDVGTLDEGGAYIVMEFLEGRDLEALLVRDGVMSVETVAGHVLQALEGIAHAHALGIVHRDLKPSNLFLAERMDGSVTLKVLDFGISKALRHDQDAAATATHTMLGSPHFMSPEQIQSAKSVDARTDLWSFGVIMYRLLTGRAPFSGENLGEVLSAILLRKPEPIAPLRPDISAAFVEVVDRCLERDRGRRFANAAELAIALEPFAPGAAASVGRICRVLGVDRAQPTAVTDPRTDQVRSRRPTPRPAAGSTKLAVGPVIPPAHVLTPQAIAGGTLTASEDAQPWAALVPPPMPGSPDLGPSAGPWSGTGDGNRGALQEPPGGRRHEGRPARLAAIGFAAAATVIAIAIASRSYVAKKAGVASAPGPASAPPPAEVRSAASTTAPEPSVQPPVPPPVLPPALGLAPLPNLAPTTTPGRTPALAPARAPAPEAPPSAPRASSSAPRLAPSASHPDDSVLLLRN